MQRSSSVTSGSGGTTGTFSYERSGLTLANDLTGNVNFELRAWRTYGGSDCSADYNLVDDNTWKVIVTLEPLVLSTSEVKAEKQIVAYPNPFTESISISTQPNAAIKITLVNAIGQRVIDLNANSDVNGQVLIDNLSELSKVFTLLQLI